MADSFKYPYETRFWAKISRGLIAFIIATFVCGIIILIPNAWRDWLFTIIPFLQGKESQATLTLLLSLSTLLYFKSNLIKILDFHLFPFFDTSSSSIFKSINRVTGELVWNGPVGKDQEAAWKTLEEWATHELGHGKFKLGWMLNGKVELKEDDEECWFKQFDCAFLLGPNGVGKTQLAKELARKLAKREHFGDSYLQKYAFKTKYIQLKYWFLRVFPSTKTYSKKLDAMVWDAATIHISGDPTDRIKNWRPSKPTFLILDDPSFEIASKLIDTLNGIMHHFWYPVRLLVLDQFIPFKLQIYHSKDQYYWRDNENKRLVVTQIGSIEWDADLLSKAYSRGIWLLEKKQVKQQSIGHLRSLKKPDDLKKLCHALDGNPFLLSLALTWLYDNQQATITDLLIEINATKGGNIQPLLDKRVTHLFDTHHATVMDTAINLNINEIVSLAAIAGRYPLDTEIYTGDLKRLFPGYHNGGITAPGPWQFCELYVQKYFEEALKHNDVKLDALIAKAFTQNRDGVLRRLLQKGWLATKIQTFIEQQTVENIELQLELVRLQINRALWIDASDIDKAITAIHTYLEKNLTAETVEILWQILQDCNNQPFVNTQKYPNYLPRNTLALQLNTCLLNQLTPDKSLAKNAKSLLDTLPNWLWATDYNLENVPNELLTPIKISVQNWVSQLLETLSQINEINERTRLAEFVRESLFIQLHLPLHDAVTAPLLELELNNSQANICQQDAIYICELYLWLSRFSPLSKRESLKNQISTIVNAEPSRETREILQVKLAMAWRYVSGAHSVISNQMENILDAFYQIDTLANQLKENPTIHEALAWAWYDKAYNREQQDLDLTSQLYNYKLATKEISRVADRFKDNNQIHEVLAKVWERTAYISVKIGPQLSSTEEIILEISKIAVRFESNNIIHELLAWTWHYLSVDYSRIPDQRTRTEEVIKKISCIDQMFKGNVNIQAALAATWYAVACARVHIPDQISSTEEVIKEIAPIADRFKGHVLIHEVLADAWQQVSASRASMPDQFSSTEEATKEISYIADTFKDNERINEALASAWERTASSRANLPDQRRSVEEIIKEILRILDRFEDNEKIHGALAWIWHHTAYARSRLPDQRRSTEEVIKEILRILDRFEDNEEIHDALAWTWNEVAYANPLARETALIEVNKLALKFSKSDYIARAQSEIQEKIVSAAISDFSQNHFTPQKNTDLQNYIFNITPSQKAQSSTDDKDKT